MSKSRLNWVEKGTITIQPSKTVYIHNYILLPVTNNMNNVEKLQI